MIPYFCGKPMPMKLKFLPIALLLFIVGCKKDKMGQDSLLGHLPKNTAVVLKIKDLTTFKSGLKNNDFIKHLDGTHPYDSLMAKLEPFSHLKVKGESLLGFVEVGKENYEFIFLTHAAPSVLQLDSLPNISDESITYEGKTYHQYGIEGKQFYSFTEENTLVVSSSQLLTENLLRTFDHEVPAPLAKLYKVADPKGVASIIINTKNANPMLASQLGENKAVDFPDFADWISLDTEMDQGKLQFNGVSLANDSLPRFLDLFENTQPQTPITPQLAPLNADGILSYTFNDYVQFTKNRQKYLNHTQVLDTLLNTTEEVGKIFMGANTVVVLKTYGSDNIVSYLDHIKTASESYQGSDIWTLSETDFLESRLSPLVSHFKANYCVLQENTLLFAQDAEVLKTMIGNLKSGSVFTKSAAYSTVANTMASESSILYCGPFSGAETLLTDKLDGDAASDLKKMKADGYTMGAQWVADGSLYLTSLVAAKVGHKVENNTISPLYNVELDADLATDPQFVINHRTHKKEIVVQDMDHNLYLISTEGKVLWKKQLEGTIQGKIHQVDLYKNGKLQLAFTTNNTFMVLDRNGEIVEPFNKTYDGGNLNGLAVFDYDNNRNYRFVVTQGKKVMMYNNQGNQVKGFTYTEAESPILGPPDHFRVGKKDYLVFRLEDGTLKILHRTGANRIQVKGKIAFSGNGAFLYKDKISVTDTQGVMHQIGTDGKESTSNFNLGKDHGMFATSNTLALMDGNTLSIKGRKTTLDLGVYTKPHIFYVYDKIYVAVTDIQQQMVYLLDSQSEPISGFPVYGNSAIDLADMDNDHKLELVAKDQENSIIVYRMN